MVSLPIAVGFTMSRLDLTLGMLLPPQNTADLVHPLCWNCADSNIGQVAFNRWHREGCRDMLAISSYISTGLVLAEDGGLAAQRDLNTATARAFFRTLLLNQHYTDQVARDAFSNIRYLIYRVLMR